LNSKEKSIGICIGASSISSVTISRENKEDLITNHIVIPHKGNPKKILEDILNGETADKLTITGRKFRNFLNAANISEPEAVEYALSFLNIKTDIVISAGGENFMIYVIDKFGKISKAVSGNKCASGTGEFFLQQIKRMNLSLEEAINLGINGNAHPISGRCSVFCKSDCTHALNKGIPKENVVAGLTKMMAQKITELTSQINFKSAILIGGVSLNDALLKHLKQNINVRVLPESPYFEALGASVHALDKNTLCADKKNIFKENHTSFVFHDDLNKYISKVRFEQGKTEKAKTGDVTILGLDVGSTTTKAILMRVEDQAILASEYLRTNGDPIFASVECYKSLKKQILVPIKIIGLGVTGSGRHIAGLQALTKGIINEIIAHAAATLYFDKNADTIFEIGGQDAKYTHITSGVPSDYAMNEACSAGTGSFLEEAANESFEVDYRQIGELALSSTSPPNFNDQCAAFISSDIKNALQEGLKSEDILAGLVYSICMNYINRVKGNRPVGKKVFMQGGVCYNKAVPIAMAALTGKEIIVPPEPGLMGAFGVALEIKKRIELNLLTPEEFNLDELINRKTNYEKIFTCNGGKEKCDLKCNISLIKVNEKTYPFGGACNKYNILHKDIIIDSENLNLVRLRQELVFNKYLIKRKLSANAKSIGVSKSFLTNTYFPLYYNFFTQLGFKVIISDEPKTEGIEKKQSSFCYPVELAHGFLQDLIDKKPDYIFLPHILDIYSNKKNFYDRTCVLLQSEVYYLKTTFKKELKEIEILSPILSFSNGFIGAKNDFVNLALELGIDKSFAAESYNFSVSIIQEMFEEFQQVGSKELERLKNNSDLFAVVLFGRAYNSFAKEANLGIPQKFSSRGITIIPHDFLSVDNFPSYEHMYWGMGNQILKAARFVKNHPQLFGTFITNFSCGPDSMLITYFRNIMEEKPSLTIELDSHSADAGINTRIEAAIDVIRSYVEVNKKIKKNYFQNIFTPVKIKDSHSLITSEGEEVSIFDKKVRLLIPSMGRYGAEAFAAAFRFIGINSQPVSIPHIETLKKGRAFTTCKECLPLILNVGSLLENYDERSSEITLYFMAEGTGPCRFGQYHIYLEDVIKKNKLRNVGIYTLTDEDSYGGLGNEFTKHGWAAITVADVIQNISHAINALAINKEEATAILENEWKKIISTIESSPVELIYKQLEKTATVLSKIKTKISYDDAVKVALTGEIYVRQDDFSRSDLIDRLSKNNIVVKVAPIGEYVYYSNYLAKRDDGKEISSLKDKIKYSLRNQIQLKIEKKIKRALSNSGFYRYELVNVENIIKSAEHLIRPEMAGEAILTVGTSLREILDDVSGVISIGPFGCMPSRVAEAILSSEMNSDGKAESDKNFIKDDFDFEDFPFLSIETDGNLFPQIIQSRIEIFMLQAERVHKKLLEHNLIGRKHGMKVLRTIYKKYFGTGKQKKERESFGQFLPETD